MKKIIQYSLLTFMLVGFTYCEDKPGKSYYGIPSEDKNQILQGIILSYNAIDTGLGSIVDIKSDLEWKKCSQGQVFRASNNDCQGGNSTATLTTPGDQGRYGATYLNYCNIEGNDCNATSLPMTLKANIVPGVISEAFNSCSALNANDPNGYKNWRVPSLPELQALASLGKVILTSSFPNTPDDFYWSSWSNEQNPSGSTAKAVSFTSDKFGETQNILKTTKLYVRCVRNINGL